MASFRESLHKMKEQKSEEKAKTKSDIHPLLRAPCIPNSLCLALQKIFRLLDLWAPGLDLPFQTQPHLLNQFP